MTYDPPKVLGAGEVAPVGNSALSPPDSLEAAVKLETPPAGGRYITNAVLNAIVLGRQAINSNGTMPFKVLSDPAHYPDYLVDSFEDSLTLRSNSDQDWYDARSRKLSFLTLSLPAKCMVMPPDALHEEVRKKYGDFFFTTDIWTQKPIGLDITPRPIGKTGYTALVEFLQPYGGLQTSFELMFPFETGVAIPLIQDPFLLLVGLESGARTFLSGMFAWAKNQSKAVWSDEFVHYNNLKQNVRMGCNFASMLEYAKIVNEPNIKKHWATLQAITT